MKFPTLRDQSSISNVGEHYNNEKPGFQANPCYEHTQLHFKQLGARKIKYSLVSHIVIFIFHSHCSINITECLSKCNFCKSDEDLIRLKKDYNQCS